MAKLIAKTYSSPASATSGISSYGTVRHTNPAQTARQRAQRRRVRLRARSKDRS